MNIKKYLSDIDRKQLFEHVVLYATTLTITLGMIYLLFPNMVSGLSEVKRVNANVVVVSEKIDSVKTSQDYLHDKVDMVFDYQVETHSALLDTLKVLDRKLNDIRYSIYQSNRLNRQNAVDIQYLKRSLYQSTTPQRSTSSLDQLFGRQ